MNYSHEQFMTWSKKYSFLSLQTRICHPVGLEPTEFPLIKLWM